MSDPHNPNVTGYVKPNAAEITARTNRNYAIAGSLFVFVIFIIVLMLYKYGAFN